MIITLSWSFFGLWFAVEDCKTLLSKNYVYLGLYFLQTFFAKLFAVEDQENAVR
jgi:hypothetical protein